MQRDQKLTLDAWKQAAQCVFGNVMEKVEFIHAYRRIFPNAALHDVIVDLVHSVSVFSEKDYVPLEDFLVAQCGAENHTLLDPHQFPNWFGKSIHFQALWDLVFHQWFMNQSYTPVKLSQNSVFLSAAHLFVLNTAIPKELRANTHVWLLMFSSDIHGKSWMAFKDRIENVGSFVLVIRDKTGSVFGAFCSQDIEPNPKVTLVTDIHRLVSRKPKFIPLFDCPYDPHLPWHLH
jgi:hypothetical protein